MNTRRKFLQITGLLTGTSLLAKSANALDHNLSTIEEKILGRSLRKLSIAHSAKVRTVSESTDKLLVHPGIAQDAQDVIDNHMVVKIYQKGLVKTGVIYSSTPVVKNGCPAATFITDLCEKAKSLKKDEKCQAVLVYLDINMPDAKAIVKNNFWVAQMHSVDILFTRQDKEKNFSRICQDRDRNELILTPLHNREDKFGGIDFLFDIGLRKSQVHIV